MVRRVLKRVLAVVSTLLLAAVFYVAVVLGEPQESEQVVRPMTDQPLLAASPAVNIDVEGQVPVLANDFPAPVLYPLPGSGLRFVSGTSYDAAFESGFGRMVSLTYQMADGQNVTVESIYPARALSLIGRKDYQLSGTAGQSLAGFKSVRMESASSIRLHAQGEEALYVVTAPKLDSAALISLTRSLQLFEGE